MTSKAFPDTLSDSTPLTGLDRTAQRLLPALHPVSGIPRHMENRPAVCRTCFVSWFRDVSETDLYTVAHCLWLF